MEKYACVTGADRGLGLALVEALLKRNYVVFAGRFLSDWDGLDQLSLQYNERLIVVSLDVADEASVRKVGQQIAERTDRIDIIINNAGIATDLNATVHDAIDYEQIQLMYHVNALGPLRMVQTLIQPLLNSESKLVVNISSEAGQINQTWRESWYGYCMSKAALNSQSNILHNHLRQYGGKVLVIHPGWVRTYMQGKLDADATLSPEEAAHHITMTIERYISETEERAHPPFWDHLGNDMSWSAGMN